MTTICYYVTGHGYGHAIRTIQILAALPPGVRVLLKTTAPERLFREELAGRDFTYIPDEFDCGCLERDSLTVLPRETLDRYRSISERNQERLAEEVDWLRRERVGCVVTDVPSFPLRAARVAGVPGAAVANFTWLDIYQEYVETVDDEALLDGMRREYAQATVALITPLNLPAVADPFPHVERVPLVARRGRNVRDSLCRALGRPAGTSLALLYLGLWGLDIAWERLAAFADWTFLTYDPPPVAVPNVLTLDRVRQPYADTMASVNAVVAKTGYGTATECIADGVPLIYPPREGFAEHAALAAALDRWGGGLPLTQTQFMSGDWGAALERARTVRLDAGAFPTNGAQVIAERLVRLCG